MIKIEYAPKLSILGEKEKRLKIIVGGRGSTKSTFVADWVLSGIANGQLWCCGREYQNTIEESVHRLLLDEVSRLKLPGFTSDKAHLYHESGGRNFYRGLCRNPSGLKSSLTGVDGLWIEEGETLSEETLRQLSASLRLSAEDVQKVIEGEDIKLPEIWITMNRGHSLDPISQKWLKRAEGELARSGIYEDDFMIIVQINYDEIPRKWFIASGLELERQDDWDNMTRSAYNHKWKGGYNDSVENSIILPEWFDAAIDAHEKIGFKPRGIKIASHDPSDEGKDAKGYCLRHGSVVLDLQENTNQDVNDGCDWATELAIEARVDQFIWDVGGMGIGLKRQVKQSLAGKKIEAVMFNGGEGVDDPEDFYQGEGLNKDDQKTNDQTFINKRAQYYWYLRDRFYKTFKVIQKKEFHSPEELISISSNIPMIQKLRSEVCSVPRKHRGNGLIQIMSKEEMKKTLRLPSPNLADSLMMSLKLAKLQTNQNFLKPIKVNSRGIL